MKTSDTGFNSTERTKIENWLNEKKYHTPQLNEWGTLENLTKGSQNGYYADKQVGSGTQWPTGRPQPLDPNHFPGSTP